MRSVIHETFKNRLVPGMVHKALNPTSTSPVKRWTGVYTLPQAVSIRFGTLFEEALNDLVERCTLFEAITNSRAKTYITPEGELTEVTKGNKDVDILFRNDSTVYYRESKCNIELDSEKSKVTANKVNEVSARLQILYPDCKIDAALLNMDWSGKRTNFHGVRIEYASEFISRLGIEDISEQDYLDIGKAIGYAYKEGVNGR